METNAPSYLVVELKPYYLNEFIVCGLPVPQYSTISGFVLKFTSAEKFLSYNNVLRTILSELELSDPNNTKYEIQRSIIFIKNLLQIMKDQFQKRYN
jgi:hypothetical protein